MKQMLSIVVLCFLFISSAFAGEISLLPVKKIINNTENKYSYIRIQETCEIYIFKKNGWDLFFADDNNIPEKYQPFLNGFIEQHEYAHCVAHSVLPNSWKRDGRVYKESWLSNKNWSVQEWADEYYADIYAMVWLSQHVNEQDWTKMVNIITRIRMDTDEDSPHDTINALRGLLPYYSVFQTLSLRDKKTAIKLSEIAALWLNDAVQRKKFIIK